MRNYTPIAGRKRQRLAINTEYEKNQLAKIEARGDLEIKEGNHAANALVIVRNKIIEILEFNDIPFTEPIVRELVRKYKDNALCDIKSHEIIVQYYKIEDLMRYMIK